MNKVKVAVNGYGVIGKRVADAVRLQPDMVLVGVGDVAHDYRVKAALTHEIPIYASVPGKADEMVEAGIPVAGTLDDLLSEVDVVVDCAPKRIGAQNYARYQEAGVKSVFQGGETHALTGHSFVAQANYESARGRSSTRVVSCNTTSTVRTLGALKDAGLLKSARGVLVRRATDPWESDHGGIMNTIVPEPHIPSHQGPDAQTVRPDLDVITIAAKAAHTQTHNHYWIVRLARETSREEVVDVFRRTPRVAFIRVGEGIVALNSTIELMKDLGRPRGDMWEVALWEDILTVNGDEAYYTYQVYNEAIVVPENIDAIRALTELASTAEASMRITDETMGIKKEFLLS